jgi:hypothetical protein
MTGENPEPQPTFPPPNLGDKFKPEKSQMSLLQTLTDIFFDPGGSF